MRTAVSNIKCYIIITLRYKSTMLHIIPRAIACVGPRETGEFMQITGMPSHCFCLPIICPIPMTCDGILNFVLSRCHAIIQPHATRDRNRPLSVADADLQEHRPESPRALYPTPNGRRSGRPAPPPRRSLPNRRRERMLRATCGCDARFRCACHGMRIALWECFCRPAGDGTALCHTDCEHRACPAMTLGE